MKSLKRRIFLYDSIIAMLYSNNTLRYGVVFNSWMYLLSLFNMTTLDVFGVMMQLRGLLLAVKYFAVTYDF